MNEQEQEAIKTLSNFFTPTGNQLSYCVRQYKEFIAILESALKERDTRIIDLEKRNKALHEIQDTQRDEIRVRDEAIAAIKEAVQIPILGADDLCAAIDCREIDCFSQACIDARTKAALDAAKGER